MNQTDLKHQSLPRTQHTVRVSHKVISNLQKMERVKINFQKPNWIKRKRIPNSMTVGENLSLNLKCLQKIFVHKVYSVLKLF